MNTFSCNNCRQVINQGAVQCPFCHHNPHRSMFGDTGGPSDRVAEPTPFVKVFVTLVMAGIFFAIGWKIFCGATILYGIVSLFNR